MKRSLVIGVVALAMIGLVAAESAQAIEYTMHCRGREGWPWHGGYYYTAWGAPVALVVPPNAEAYMSWGWGVGNTRVNPLCHQFTPNWPGPVSYDPQALRPTPRWPSDTDQLGVYYVRGPW